jgi:hypothetical protein
MKHSKHICVIKRKHKHDKTKKNKNKKEVKGERNLNELHEKVNIFGVKLSGEILDSLIKHGSQGVLFSSY